MTARPDPLAERLRTLAEAELPQATQEALSRALDRAERDARILAAGRLAGGCAALLELLRRDGWRIDVWRQRGKVPEIAPEPLRLLFAAGPLPCSRHLRRILDGHAMSGDPG